MRFNYGFGFNDGDTIAALRNTIIPKRGVVGTPWYQLLSNPKYSNAFMYIGAFVDERHEIIEDGQPDEGEMTEEKKKMRCEQSDLIMILLNLGYLPDSVIQKISNFNPGWSMEFKRLMNDHWDQEQFRPWMTRLQEEIEEVRAQNEEAVRQKREHDEQMIDFRCGRRN